MAFIIIIVNRILVIKAGLRPLMLVKLVLEADILLLAAQEDVISLGRGDRLAHHHSQLFIFVQVLKPRLPLKPDVEIPLISDKPILSLLFCWLDVEILDLRLNDKRRLSLVDRLAGLLDHHDVALIDQGSLEVLLR